MGRFRRFMRRLAKPAVMGMVAGSLALSLVVTTPSNAQAFVGEAKQYSWVRGAVRTAGPLLLGAVRLHPVGFAVSTVVTLGLIAYETRDTWMPYVSGTFGDATPKEGTNTAPGGLTAYPNLILSNVTGIGTQTVKVTATWNNQPSSGFANFHVAFRYECDWDQAGFANSTFNSAFNITNKTFPFAPLELTNPCTATQGATSLTGKVVAADFGMLGTNSFRAWQSGDKTGGPWNYIAAGKFGNESFDPRGATTKYLAEVECIDDNGVKSWISSEVTGDMGGIKFPSCAAAGKGHGTGVMRVKGLAPGKTTYETLWETTAPSDPNYDLCNPGRPGGGCKMAIWVDGKECVEGVWECEYWTEINQTTPQRVECRWGPYTLDAGTQCQTMEPAYRPGGAPATGANTDGNPATRSNLDIEGNPQTQPSTATGTVPSNGTSTIPGGAGGTPSGEAAECWPSGYGVFNPVDWVLKPVSCALEAAFVPKKSMETRLQTMQGQFSNRVPISWFSTGTQGVSGGSCPTDWALEVAGQHVSLICGTPVEGILLSFRPIMGAMLVIAALWPLVRSLFYAVIPVFKVTPS